MRFGRYFRHRLTFLRASGYADSSTAQDGLRFQAISRAEAQRKLSETTREREWQTLQIVTSSTSQYLRLRPYPSYRRYQRRNQSRAKGWSSLSLAASLRSQPTAKPISAPCAVACKSLASSRPLPGNPPPMPPTRVSPVRYASHPPQRLPSRRRIAARATAPMTLMTLMTPMATARQHASLLATMCVSPRLAA